MCCFLLSLIFLGPRIVNIIWWIFRPLRWQAAFTSWPILWWLWPVLGILLLPWTTMMFVLVAPGGVTGFDWLWLGLMLIVDVTSYVGGGWRSRSRNYLPGDPGSRPPI